jgi:hypothetical protein
VSDVKRWQFHPMSEDGSGEDYVLASDYDALAAELAEVKRTTVPGVAWDDMNAAVKVARADRDRLRAALERIAEGRGRFSVDQYLYACNTIQDMKEIAREALRGSDQPPASRPDPMVQCKCGWLGAGSEVRRAHGCPDCGAEFIEPIINLESIAATEPWPHDRRCLCTRCASQTAERP